MKPVQIKESLNNVMPDSIRHPLAAPLDSGFRRNDGFVGRVMVYLVGANRDSPLPLNIYG